MDHYDIYRDQLAITFPSFGHALWEPTPEGEYGLVKVGDVGYVRDGRFFRLFNALLPANDASHNDTRLPEYHEPLIPNIPNHIFKGVLMPNDYCSAGVNVEPEPEFLATGPPEFTRTSFLCRKRRGGAVLSLPVEAQRQDTRAREDFGKWMLKHIDCWFAFARGLGIGIERMEEIILVTGCDCTRSRANIAFLEGQAQKMARFGFKVIQGDGVSVYWQFLHGNSQGAVCNWGPIGQNLQEDQCVFIRGFRVVRILGILPKQLKGAAGPNPSPGGDDEPDKELISIPTSTKLSHYRDPLNVLLDYIVERVPDCDMVLVHDDDLSRIGRFHDGNEDLQPDSLMTYLQKAQPEIQQVPCDCPLINESNSKTETITVAMLSKEFQEWGLGSTPPRPGLGQSCAYGPGQLKDQGLEGNTFGPPQAVDAGSASVNDLSTPLIVDGYISRCFTPMQAERYFKCLLKNDTIPSHPPIRYHGTEGAFFIVSSVPRHIRPQISRQSGWVLDRGVVDKGTVVPQTLWTPHTHTDRRKHVEETELQLPIFFQCVDGTLGIPLEATAAGRLHGFRNHYSLAPLGFKSTTHIHIVWPGYIEFKRQVPTRDETTARNPITYFRFAHHIVRSVDAFLKSCQPDPACPNQKWLIGEGGIRPRDIMIIGAVHVSPGSWMPILQLNRFIV